MFKALIAAMALCMAATTAAQTVDAAHWIASWGTSQPLGPPPPPPKVDLSKMPPPAPSDLPSPLVRYPHRLVDQTVRMIVRTGAGGGAFRLEFSNAEGQTTVTFDSIHAALAGPGAAIVAGSDRAVTFGGRPELTLFPGARAVSDPVTLAVPALSDIAVSVHVPEATPVNTVHPLGLNPAYIAAGDVTAAASLDHPQRTRSYFWLSGLDVPAARPEARTPEAGTPEAGTIVVLGDSISDGFRTTPGAHQDWPELLAARLQADPHTAGWGVVNAGISGNRILKAGAGDAAVARFDVDVFARPGVKWVLVLEGINDINDTIMPIMPASEAVTAQQIIDGLSQMIDRAHLHGIQIAGGTILGTKGLPFYTAQGEAMRQAVNRWIRTGGRFDAVIDFDAATRDSRDPDRLRPAFDSGDHVHPNDAGNHAMANAIDLGLFH